MKALIEFLLSLFVKKKPKKYITPKDSEIDKNLVEARDESEEEYIPIRYKKDQQRLKDEFDRLGTENAYLQNIANELNDYTNKKFKKGIVITMIYRTQAEQDYLYRNSAKYAKKKFKSPHQFWHGLDIRSRTFTKAEIKEIVDWLNKKHNKNQGYYKWTAKCHNVGSGMHFHIQFSR